MASLRLPFLGLLLLAIQGAGAAERPNINCDKTNIDIKGGTYTLSDGGNMNSKLEYKCPEGKYAYPVLSRTCTSLGKWTTMKLAEGKTVEKAICKDVQCPRPVDFEHGSYYPRENFYNLGSSLEFECYEGYKLRGSLNRTCMANGKWSGDTAICDDGSSPCPHPGQPIGSIKFGNRYNIEDVVKYQCQRGLSMFGSSQRVCLESHEWSGTEPSCRQKYTFDTPDEVASSFIGSLSAAIEVADKNKESETKTQRKIKIEPGGNLNIYVILDASESVKKDNFDKAKDCVVSLIEKIATYDITPRYIIITYATEPQVLMDLEDEDSTKADVVIDKLMEFDYESHNEKSGTNTRGAIDKVYHMMSLHQQRNKDKFAAIRHVIILMTDGKANMGGDPKISMARIRDFVNITLGREDYLDVYVFGLGDEVSDDEINGLASKKDREKHVFKVADITDLGKTFNEMIDEESAMNMCGMSKEYTDPKKDEEKQEMNPWLASISTTRDTGVEKCKGSVLSPHYILTAAHCFTIEDQAHSITVETDVARNPQKFRVKSITSHPNYNINSKKPKFAEFYDYDIALVETIEKITFNSRVRPICIPCTEGTTRALKKSHPQTTCQDHEAELLPLGLVGALFVSEDKAGLRRYNVKAKTGDQEKAVCNKDALKAQSVRNLKKIFIYENVTDVSEVVTDRFLCTGGTEPEVDPYTCKGDSGGPLLISKKNRYIQVGVISWGVTNLCDKMERKAQTQTYSRDFYLNLFKVMPWLKEMLKDEGLQFLP